MTHARRTLLTYTLSLLLFGLPVAVFSQEATGSVYGVVTDVNGALVPRARIIAKIMGAQTSAVASSFETYTDDHGSFNLKNLPSGYYEVHVTRADSEEQLERIVSIPKGEAVEVLFELGHGCSKISEGSGIVNDTDKAEVVRLTLVQALNSKLGLLVQKQRDEGVILSTRNIRPEWVKDVAGLRIRLLSQKQIQRKADLVGDFLYLSFPEIRVRGNCIAVTLTNSWAVGKHSRMVYLSGGGYTYEYRKQMGKWTGKFVSGWIS